MEVPTLTVPQAERKSGLAGALLEEALAGFRSQGTLRLVDALDPGLPRRLHQHVRRRYRAEWAGSHAENGRPLHTLDVEGPVADPAFYAAPAWMPLVRAMLGEDCILGACSIIFSFPGAPEQYLHRDTQSLYGDFAVDCALPCSMLTVLVPLVSVDSSNGSTRVWPGSHRNPDMEAAFRGESLSPDMDLGSVLINDSRIVHRGSPNPSDRMRPVAYLSYHRKWYRDRHSYSWRPGTRVHPDSWDRIPEAHRPMFVTALEDDPALRSASGVGP